MCILKICQRCGDTKRKREFLLCDLYSNQINLILTKPIQSSLFPSLVLPSFLYYIHYSFCFIHSFILLLLLLLLILTQINQIRWILSNSWIFFILAISYWISNIIILYYIIFGHLSLLYLCVKQCDCQRLFDRLLSRIIIKGHYIN